MSARSIHARSIFVLAAVLAIDQADKGAIGALGPTLEREFHISHFSLGALAGAFSVVAAIAVVPAGVLTDRVRRTALLAGSVALWSVAMLAGGFAVSFVVLLVTRMFLGVVTATGGPTISSLTGDYFPRAQRARSLGLIQLGEMVGLGIGFLLVGVVLSALSWRWVFWILAAAGAALVFALVRLPEPKRGASQPSGARHRDLVAREIDEQHIAPNPNTVLHTDPDDLPLPAAMHDVVKVETNVIVIIASGVGYFFLAGLRVFAVLFATHQYGLSNATASLLVPVIGIGAVIGIVGGGRVADALLRKGNLAARLLVPIFGFVVATVAFLPAMLTHSLVIALPLLIVGAAGLTAPNPSLDAVRLDVIHPKLWGRAESVRTLFRTIAEAIAPILLGLLADRVGLQHTMLLMLPALLLNGLILSFATRRYPHDVASVIASQRRIPTGAS